MTWLELVGDSHSLFVDAGALYYFGSGLGSQQQLPTQVSFPAGTQIVDVAAGFSHMLAVTSKGEVYSWGHGTMGQLGHGEGKSGRRAKAPKLVEGLRGVAVARVFAGGFYSVAVTSTPAITLNSLIDYPI